MLRRSLYSDNFRGSIGCFIEHFKVEFKLGSSDVAGPVGGFSSDIGPFVRLLLVEVQYWITAGDWWFAIGFTGYSNPRAGRDWNRPRKHHTDLDGGMPGTVEWILCTRPSLEASKESWLGEHLKWFGLLGLIIGFDCYRMASTRRGAQSKWHRCSKCRPYAISQENLAGSTLELDTNTCQHLEMWAQFSHGLRRRSCRGRNL